MNPTAVDPVPAPPQPPQPHRSSFSCDRHPDEQFTGFCPSCLCERLTTLDQSLANDNKASSSRRNSTSAASAAAAIKSLFSKPSISNNPFPPPKHSKPTTSFLSELRRTKSFSASNAPLGLKFEPQRKSCDVRNTLSTLFTLDDVYKTTSGAVAATTSAAGNPSSSASQTQHPHFISNDVLVNRAVEKSEEDEIEEVVEEYQEVCREGENCFEERFQDRDNRVEEMAEIQQPRISYCSEIIEEDVVFEESFIKPMKDHIDIESQAKKTNTGGGMKEIAGTFRSAASVLSKKWQKWRSKQKVKKQNSSENSGTLPVEKPLSRQYRETQSEIADYGYGRRSCDIDPRFSLDAGRISFDDPRYSFEEPRASWDGYMIGRSFPRMNPMVSLVEDAPVVHVPRSDSQISVEEPRGSIDSINGDESVPGGSIQTKEYYADSSSRRRKSLDRSSSIKKTAASVVAEIDEMKVVSNAKVSPTTVDGFNGAKVLVGERVLRHSKSLRDDCSETFELGSLRDNASVIGNGERKESKKSRRWSWNIWGLIQRRSGGNKGEDDERYSTSTRTNGVERSFSGSWQELRRDSNGDSRGGLNPKVFRSNSSVSWRNSTSTNFGGSFGTVNKSTPTSTNFGGSFGTVNKSSVEMNGHARKKTGEFVLERNQSARYSPKNIGNGLLRFYLAPMGSSRRGGPGKNRLSSSHSIARSVLQHV